LDCRIVTPTYQKNSLLDICADVVCFEDIIICRNDYNHLSAHCSQHINIFAIMLLLILSGQSVCKRVQQVFVSFDNINLKCYNMLYYQWYWQDLWYIRVPITLRHMYFIKVTRVVINTNVTCLILAVLWMPLNCNKM